MTMTQIVDAMRADGSSDEEINDYLQHDYPRDCAEAQADFIEEYESRPDVQAGWHQQDLIDRRRMEQ